MTSPPSLHKKNIRIDTLFIIFPPCCYFCGNDISAVNIVALSIVAASAIVIVALAPKSLIVDNDKNKKVIATISKKYHH